MSEQEKAKATVKGGTSLAAGALEVEVELAPEAGADTYPGPGFRYTSKSAAMWAEQPGYREHEVVITATVTGARLGRVSVVAQEGYSPAGVAAQAATEWVIYAPQIKTANLATWDPLPLGGITATAPSGATATLADDEAAALWGQTQEENARWKQRLLEEPEFRALWERTEQHPDDHTALEALIEYERKRRPWPDEGGEAIAPEAQPQARGRSSDSAAVPQEIPQQTFPEAKAVAIAIADGPLLRRWLPIPGEIALRHGVKGAMLETKLIGSPLLDWLGRPNTIDSLQSELRGLGLPAVLLLHVVIGGALEQPRVYVRAAIDELIKAIGWTPRSRQERHAQRREVWRWLLMMDAMRVIGQRRGKYRDPDTREVIDTRIHDALIRVMSTEEEEGSQLSFDGSQPPLTVTYAPGPWIEQWKGRRDILWYFGDVRRLAAIPAGKPSGAWAQAIGLALQQLWRERAAYAEIGHVGEDNHPTPRFHKAFTRRDLLDLFQPDPTVYAILASANPKRARDYWHQAITLLKDEGIIGHYQETAPLAERRQDWADEWLDRPLDIRPKNGTERAAAVVEIAGRAKAARKTRGAHRARRASP